LLRCRLFLDLGAMMSDHAACGGAGHGMVTGHVPGNGTNRRSLHAAF
jgi:hypothetical protein